MKTNTLVIHNRYSPALPILGFEGRLYRGSFVLKVRGSFVLQVRSVGFMEATYLVCSV